MTLAGLLFFTVLFSCSRSSDGIRQISNSGLGAYEASLAVLPDGFVSAWYDVRDGNPEIYFRVLDSSGRPKSGELRVTNDKALSYEADVAAIDGNIAIGWYERSLNKSLRAKIGMWTSDGRKLWEQTISPPARNGRNTVVRSRGHELFCAWIEDNAGEDAEVWAGWWNVEGRQVTQPRRLAPAGKTTWNLNAAIDSSGKAWVVFDAKAGTRNNELFAVCTDCEGNRVIRLTADDGISSKYPDIGFSGDSVALTWFDERDGNSDVHLFIRSIDGLNEGMEAHSQQITHTPGASVGDYLAWNGERLGLAWCDNTAGQHEIYFQTFDRNGKAIREPRQMTHNRTDSLIPAIKPFGDSFALVWNEYTPQSEDSHDGGQSEIEFTLAR